MEQTDGVKELQRHTKRQTDGLQGRHATGDANARVAAHRCE